MTGDNGPANNHGDADSEILAPTQRLYYTQEGNEKTECLATVLEIVEDTTSVAQSTQDESESPALPTRIVHVVLDQTVLHAQGGGQPTDYGQIILQSDGPDHEPPVIQVHKVSFDRSTGVVTHTGSTTSSESWIGRTVRVQVDVARRLLLSECHSAGHVVDATLTAAGLGSIWKPTKGYHFLDGPYVEYSLNSTDDANTALVTDKSMLPKLQQIYSDLIAQDIPTQIDLLSIPEADSVCNRLTKNFDVSFFAEGDQVRVVSVAGFSCPCGGTHVRSTGALQSWNITNIKGSKKNTVVRIKYGRTAV
jgi:alanyl-tRNA synthetase